MQKKENSTTHDENVQCVDNIKLSGLTTHKHLK